MSFDFVLRKHGAFVPFNQTAPAAKTGRERFAEGSFLGPVVRRAQAVLGAGAGGGGGAGRAAVGRRLGPAV